MEITFKNDAHPVCVTAHPVMEDRLAIGFLDGNWSIYKINLETMNLKVMGGKKLKQAVRRIVFSPDGECLYSVGVNRSLCTYDLTTLQRIRCICESHDAKPSSLAYLPSTSTKGQQLATGSETGEVRTWDLRADTPLVCTYHDLEDDINGFGIYKNTLLAASADGTLGAYDLRKRQLIVRSEPMQSELLCIEVGDSFTYVGGGNGFLEVFNNGEYGNILERIACRKGKGVDHAKVLRPGVVLTGSCEENELRMYNLNPYQKLGIFGTQEGGVNDVELSVNKKWACTTGFLVPSAKFWDLESVIEKLPVIRADGLPKKKGPLKRSDFFDDLCEEASDEDEEESMDDEEHEPSDLNELVDPGESLSEESSVGSDESDESAEMDDEDEEKSLGSDEDEESDVDEEDDVGSEEDDVGSEEDDGILGEENPLGLLEWGSDGEDSLGDEESDVGDSSDSSMEY